MRPESIKLLSHYLLTKGNFKFKDFYALKNNENISVTKNLALQPCN